MIRIVNDLGGCEETRDAQPQPDQPLDVPRDAVEPEEDDITVEEDFFAGFEIVFEREETLH